MSVNVTTSFVKQFSANVQLLVQQMGSRLRNTVTLETGKVGEEVFMDRIESVAAQRVNTRHADSPLMSTPHDRRKVTPSDFDWGDMIDNPDKLRMLIDPASAYSANASMAMGRAMDETIISALVGTAKSDASDGTSNADTSVALPSSQKIAINANNYVVEGSSESGNQGLTVGKLIEARKILGANDADDYDVNGNSNLFLVVNSSQLANLLKKTVVASADYNEIRALVAGDLNQYMGFNIIRTELIPKKGGTHSSGSFTYDPADQENSGDPEHCIAYHRRGIGLCIWEDIVARISERPDKRFSQYIYYRMTLGATRLEEKRVVQISCLQ
jgi:hypothetical protein